MLSQMALTPKDPKVLASENSYTEVKVILFGTKCLHYCTHVAAVLKDPIQGQSTLVEFGAGFSFSESKSSLRINEIDNLKHYCCIKSVTLYSDKKLASFVTAYNKQFDSNNYSCLTNNCSDAIGFTLDYFFPESTIEKTYQSGFQLLLSAGMYLTCGLTNLFPAPPLISTPTDIFKKAQSLASRYGYNSFEKMSTNTEEVKETKENKNSTQKMISAITKDELIDIKKQSIYLLTDKRNNQFTWEDVLLYQAINDSDHKTIEELLKRGINPNSAFKTSSEFDLPAIFSVLKNHSTNILALLIKYNLDVNQGLEYGVKTHQYTFAKGTTLLMYAALFDCASSHVLTLLANAGAQLDAKSSSGSTPAHWAAAAKNEAYIKFFQAKKVSFVTKNNASETPQTFAERMNPLLNKKK